VPKRKKPPPTERVLYCGLEVARWEGESEGKKERGEISEFSPSFLPRGKENLGEKKKRGERKPDRFDFSGSLKRLSRGKRKSEKKEDVSILAGETPAWRRRSKKRRKKKRGEEREGRNKLFIYFSAPGQKKKKVGKGGEENLCFGCRKTRRKNDRREGGGILRRSLTPQIQLPPPKKVRSRRKKKKKRKKERKENALGLDARDKAFLSRNGG